MGILDRPEDLNLDLEDETNSAHLAEGNDPEEENYEYSGVYGQIMDRCNLSLIHI